MLLAIDLGTTNSKVGLFNRIGQPIAVASRETETFTHREGYAYYDPEGMWNSVAASIQEVLKKAVIALKLNDSKQVCIEAIGITSMAESGLLLDRQSGKPKSVFMPWFDTCSQSQAEWISNQCDVFERFCKSGLLNSFKLGLAKILWLKERDPDALNNAVWLSASSYIAYRLTGNMAFDYSLAARTYAFRIDTKEWDHAWIRHLGLDPGLFPPVLPATAAMGRVRPELCSQLGLNETISVSIGGHDHVCSALAVGAITPGKVYDSMGTAETLVGTMDEQPLGRKEFAAGLSFGCHIAPERYFWMGGNSASGGSIEWLRTLLADEKLSYEQLMQQLLEATDEEPTGILYYPYLSGSGAPVRDAKAKAAFVGLTKKHGKADMIKAVLEGTSFQLAAIREEAEAIAGHAIEKLFVVGGGTRNKRWLQIKADILNCSLELPPIEEATLLGAAMAAGVGAGVYSSVEDAVHTVQQKKALQIQPQENAHKLYSELYHQGFKPLQKPLRAFYSI